MQKPAPAQGRRWQAALILSLFLVAVVGAAAAGWWYARESPPHQGPIILLSVDRLPVSALATYGAASSASPAIDALAAESVVFDRAFAHGTHLLPAVASIVTGQLPFQHGVRDEGGFLLRPEARTLAEALKNRGFNTSAVVSSYLLRRETGLAQGFNAYDADLGDAPATLDRVGFEAVDAAERWARGQSDQRYFLMVEVNSEAADSALTRLTALLRERRQYDDSTIVVVGNRATANTDTLDETTLRVPLLIKQPEGDGGGRRVTGDVQQIDLLPTVLDFVRAPIPADVRGRSLRPVLDGDAQLRPQPLYAESLEAYFRFGGRPVFTVSADADAPIDPPFLVSAVDEERLALAGYLPGLPPVVQSSYTLEPSAQNAVMDATRRAAVLAGDRKYSAAIRALEGITRQHPGLASVHYQRGLLLTRSGRTDEAIAAYRTAGELRPDAVQVPLALTDALLRAGNVEEAGEQAEVAVALAEPQAKTPGKAQLAAAYEASARVALAARDTAAAEKHAQAAQAANPALPMPEYIRGRLHFADGRYEDALAGFEDAARALRQSGGSIADLQMYLGETLAHLGRYSEAETAFRDELRTFPHNIQAYTSLAMLYRATDRDADVESVLTELVESSPTPEGYGVAARLWTILGERSRAEALRSDALTRFRGDPSLALLGRDSRR